MKQSGEDFLKARVPRQKKKGNHMAVNADMKALLEAGAHFGHKTSRWHPKMAPYIHSKRQNAHIINLEKTVEGFDKALPKLTEIAKHQIDGSREMIAGEGSGGIGRDALRDGALGRGDAHQCGNRESSN